MAVALEPIVLARPRPTKLAEYEAAGGYTALAKARAMTPDEVTEELLTSELRGRGGAFFPTGRKWSFVPSKEQIPKPHYLVVNADESEPGQLQGQRDPRARPAPLHRGLPDHGARDRLQQNVFVYIRGEYSGPYEILVGALEELQRPARAARRRDDRRPPRRRRVHLRRGDGAARVARGQARPAALEAAVPGDLGPLRVADRRQQRRDDRDRAADHRDGRRRVREARRRRTRAARASSRSPATSCNGGNYEIEAGMSLREIIYDLGGGIPDGRELKAVVPGGSSTVILHDGRDRRRLRLRLARAAAHGDGLGRDRRARRPLLHRAARHPLLGVLRARVVRQVHAVPRGHALADGDPAQARGRPRDAGRPRPAARRLRPDQRQVPLPARRLRRDHRRELRREVPRRVPVAHIDEGGCPFGGDSSLDHVLGPDPDARASTSASRCTHEHAPSSSPSRSTSATVQVPKGTGMVETAAAAGIEIPVFCYEPRLGPPVGACRMCLVEVEGMPKLQAGCTLTAQDGMVVKTARTSAAGRRRPERDARVHPRQPPARLPRLRQGRRVPAAGPDVPLRARQHAHDVPEADLREADPDLAADRARPRALHPLLPLHALQRGRRRGRPARRDQPRRRSR